MNNWCICLVHIKEMHGSRSKIPSKKSRPYIYDVKFLALLGAPYIYMILVGKGLSSKPCVGFCTLNFRQNISKFIPLATKNLCPLQRPPKGEK
jgi:hypothetical protein